MILTWVGIVYVLPFLLFSSAAGVLADRFSKQKMIIFLKFTEVIIMFLGIIAFLFKSDWASYSLLFLLSMQSAIFGPPKYSIIPELVKQEHIPKANGFITSFTYFGIIVGTFLASFFYANYWQKLSPFCGRGNSDCSDWIYCIDLYSCNGAQAIKKTGELSICL